jgi:pyridoxal phosphate-dependent aminotransferase EpsN
MPNYDRIYLSPPHLGELEQTFVQEAFDTNWIAPMGPNVDAFEEEFCEIIGSKYALATSSGTAALHLALIEAGVGAGDEVLVPSLTFAASINAIVYQDAVPVLVDSELESWNVDPALLREVLQKRATSGMMPKALVLVHLYGQCANVDPILEACEEYGVAVIEDAAEALGASYKGTEPGTFGQSGIFSFNGNKIITTSGGGMLVSNDKELIDHARKLSTQARDPAPHYQHSEIGYNYRLSNVLAGIGRGQLRVLEDRVAARRGNFAYYEEHLGDLAGVEFQPEAAWGTHTRWLTVLTIDPEAFGATRDDVRLALEAENIEARPVWKPMHMQPVFAECEMIGGAVAEEFFEKGLCLPSGSSLSKDQLDRVIEIVRNRSR